MADGFIQFPATTAVDYTAVGTVDANGVASVTVAAPATIPSAPLDVAITGAHAYVGTPAADTLVGLDGQWNVIRGHAGDDPIHGGTGFNDINGNQGADTIVGRSQVGDWLAGGQGDDSISAWSSHAHNLIFGNLGDDTLSAGAGGDTLRGGQGDDSIVGGAGGDWISGDKGHDTVTGGGGADTFHGGSGMGLTTITDFQQAEGDRIQLDHGSQYSAIQVGADVHVDIAGGGELILQHTQLASLTSGWLLET